jgi:dihydrofolate reductase/thymidylate synthase
MFNLIVATDVADGIAKNNTIPWHIPSELKYFKGMTASNEWFKTVVIMGYNTWKSLPIKPLPNRINVIVTKNHYDEIEQNDDVVVFNNLFTAINKYHNNFTWIIGGKQIYTQCLYHPDLNCIYLTKIYKNYDCDIFLKLPKVESIIHSKIFTVEDIDNNKFEKQFISYKIHVYKPKFNAEAQYLRLCYDTLHTGNQRNTRNGITLSTFGKTLSFDLSDGFPLLTTKKMFWKGIVEELLFFLRGDTDSKLLQEKGVNIWKGNTSKEFIQSVKLPYEEGDMGPMYGYQWRFFNKDYKTKDKITAFEGIDQLKQIINQIKNNPTNRRILMTDYNPNQVFEGVLAPCHSIVLQFYVESGKLSCQMYQRSADVFLGLPFNIASTSLLTYIIANVCNLNVGKVTICLGDTHIYEEHKECVLQQLTREYYDFPNVHIKKELDNIEDIEQLTFADFDLVDYKHHAPIKASMKA